MKKRCEAHVLTDATNPFEAETTGFTFLTHNSVATITSLSSPMRFDGGALKRASPKLVTGQPSQGIPSN